MKTCIAQTKSIKGNISKNITSHIQRIKRAITFKPDLILFLNFQLQITNLNWP